MRHNLQQKAMACLWTTIVQTPDWIGGIAVHGTAHAAGDDSSRRLNRSTSFGKHVDPAIRLRIWDESTRLRDNPRNRETFC